MSDSVQMPALGESVTEGTVTRWLKAVGEHVDVDEPLLEVSTDKVDTEIPSPFAGVLEEILVAEDETVQVGAALARIGSGEGASGNGASSDGAAAGAPKPEAAAATEPEPEPQAKREPQAQAQPEEPEPQAPAASAASSGGGTPVLMPALGESVTEGTVTRWLKAVGEHVDVDEPLLEVSTDKVDTEIPSPVAGTVTEILVAEDETVAVGAQLALVGDAGATSAPAPAAGGGDQHDDGHDAEGHDDGDVDEAAGSLEAEAADQEAAAEQSAQSSAPPAAPSAAPPVPESSSGPAPSTATGDDPQRRTSDEYTSLEPQTGGAVRPPLGEEPSTPPSGGDVSAYVTPLVRKLAASEGVDLSTVTGTGVGGRVRKQDVLDAAAKAREAEQAKKAAPAAAASAPSGGAPSGSATSPSAAGSSAGSGVAAKRGTTEKMTRLRKVIAQRMVESLQTSAQLTSVVEVDVTRIARLRARTKDAFKAREGATLSFLPFFTLASVEALKAFPQVNASIEGENIVYHPQENVGIAVDTERGLLVPVIKDAGDLNLAGIARKIADLAARTRANKVTPDELGGGTFTITNTGSRGALFDTPIINQPQVAILGTGAVVKRPVVAADADGVDTIAIRSMVYLALSYDHRLVDGADAARFLTALKTRLEEGAFESDLGL